MIFSSLSQKTDVMAKHLLARLVARYHNYDGYIMRQFIALAKVEPQRLSFCGFWDGLIYRLFTGILILIISPLTAIRHTLQHTIETGKAWQTRLRQMIMLS
ncbi:hypothetical protein QE197_13390 [Arsenophonus nasoniae]|uniref:Uncharacterized protein n=1 Tax=Arsenophonus nasoniae TaxID=638 RepID=D2TXS2_9GAMM|nr:hypothetical protein [Arsenophonus nasoniae]QBY44480.1 hypothetical protein ArsFIN_30660 [Arsenophonus nasoniae]WGM00716.1 hypothetical protein QE210_12750 [Arsenophonus nasoniae]WGM04744.1 hypothetical protein QE258_14220 [Arsenophonus nasoniae]WGM09844.1 hypothetical protein QE197_13390 [Arsenophonus nasoniae]WGM14562.1 hypothetical protein QE193_13290 [Arsenophonus nasoniae]